MLVVLRCVGSSRICWCFLDVSVVGCVGGS